MARMGVREWQRVQKDVGGWVPRPGLVQGRPVDQMGEISKSRARRRMPDVPLKITKYVIFALNQIASSVGFLGRWASCIKYQRFKSTYWGLEGGGSGEHFTYRGWGPGDWGQGLHCEVLREASPLSAQRDPLSRSNRQGN